MKHESDGAPEPAIIQELRSEVERLTALLQMERQHDGLLAEALQFQSVGDRFAADLKLLEYGQATLRRFRRQQFEAGGES